MPRNRAAQPRCSRHRRAYVQGIELRHEYEVAAPQAGLTAAEIEQAQRNGLSMAFLSDSEKKMLLDKVATR